MKVIIVSLVQVMMTAAATRAMVVVAIATVGKMAAEVTLTM